MKKITVDRSKWGPSFLLNAENGDMCCIGQAAEQCGASLDALKGRAMDSAVNLHLDARLDDLPADDVLRRFLLDLAGYQIGTGASIKAALAYLNDAYHRTPADSKQRGHMEAAFAAGFATAGYDVEFC